MQNGLFDILSLCLYIRGHNLLEIEEIVIPETKLVIENGPFFNAWDFNVCVFSLHFSILICDHIETFTLLIGYLNNSIVIAEHVFLIA